MQLRQSLVTGCIVLAGVMTGGFAQEYAPDLPLDHPAIRYIQSPPDDPVARLARRIESGEATLEYRDDGLGYLASLLERLGINTDTQALVFSKTSFQASKISPANPRAIYFNDDVAIAFVRGAGEVEIAAIDPKQGPVFYTASVRESGALAFNRREVCVKCHQGPATSGVPGLFVGSVFAGPSGAPFRGASAIITDHRTAFEERWGGWYVNAKRGQRRDRANAVASNPAEPEVLDEQAQNLTHLLGKFDSAGYPAAVSDIVALMTFEHQTQMTNYITRVGWQARILEHEGNGSGGSAQLGSDLEAMVSYMLFAQEAPLREQVEGVSTFTRTFQERGPRDRHGRSLRDFDLETRLFRYPLSYMVYSAAFDSLPQTARQTIYRRLYAVLTGEDTDPKFGSISSNDRRAILEILRDTKPDLPAFWVAPPER